MHLLTVVLAIAIILASMYFLFSSPALKRNGKPLRRSLDRLPFVGNGLVFLQPREKLFAWFVRCERHFGLETFQISVPTLPPGVVINDPKNLEYVLKNEGIFSKGNFFTSRAWDLFGKHWHGIINADGELWKVQRRAGIHFLSNANLKVLTEHALPEYLRETVALLRTEASTDLSAIFDELTTQLFGRMAYNMEMHHLDPFAVAFDYASGITGERFQNPLWKITEKFTGGPFRKSVSKVKAFGSEIVAKAVSVRKSKGSVSKADLKSESAETFEGISGTLINSLLDTISDHQIVANAALNFLTADPYRADLSLGRDTTAQALTWLFYLLMKNPNVAETIRAEVDNVTETGSSAEGSSPRADFDTALFQPISLPYTMACFYEALRLYPVIPFELRQCVKASTLPDGTFLPKDTVLVWCTWAMNRSKNTWGNDADEFRPDRWIEDQTLITKTAFEFPVFNGGPRICLGKKMAESVAVQVIATLISHFDFEPLDDKERVSKNSLTLPMEGGLPANVKSRLL
ncbi:Cytochrome P450 94A1 [Lachnellula suecica]|uniref:Cytochrome P450 94A1 n=1 Tax=Lachnellula suecica TaxID=602035 RepID=A0A8T9CHA2_9HELO|nr:Cytochrome P450 94A1 [Lachnellula suecica]